MIDRYSVLDMNKIWDVEARFHYLLQVEKAVAKVQGRLKIIPVRAARDIQNKGKFQLKRIQELEITTKHDVIAFVRNVAENIGEPSGKYVHFSLTSSDVLDTASSLQFMDALKLVIGESHLLDSVLAGLIKKHARTICAGRTHGVWAEPTTFGFKLAGFRQELLRNIRRLQLAREQIGICKLSGAVGTYSASGVQFEQQVAKELGLEVEEFATQVVPRDRHGEVFAALALMATGIERLAVELRHLQRSEVDEVRESFEKGQKGSSAMPHKQNPISAENLTGLARLVRSYQSASLENIVLWHERDISHSSVERVIFPDVFHLSLYMIRRMTSLLKSLTINKDNMKRNLEASQGKVFTSHALLFLIEK
ncbi:MAG TPA: adenylosuccinate lyase, partial [Pseudobdellovibrionaceae bacterium]|nr:adenylosuccinate lyase [Pseudobdellovibrionaceae bacterium]